MKNWKILQPFQSRAFILAAILTAALFAYEQLFLPFQVHDFLEVFSPAVQALVTAVSIALMVLFFWAALTAGFIGRVFTFLLFLAALITEYSYVSAVGRFSIIQDYETGLTAANTQLIQNAMESYTSALLMALGPALVFGVCLMLFRRIRGSWYRLLVVLAASVVIYTTIFSYCRGTFPTVSFEAGLRTFTFTSLKLITSYRGPRLDIPAYPAHPPENNIILVVDESVRCDRLSLNGYHRKTTLYLEQLKKDGLLTNWGEVAASATMSLNSNVYLVTGVTDMPDTGQNSRRVPTIFHYAKAAGYNTYHLDAQMDTLWLVQPADQKVIDHWYRPRDLSDHLPVYDIDFVAARKIHEIIHSSTGNFIWVNKSGVHFPYPMRYPQAAGVWRPVLKDNGYDYHQYLEISNSYDNSILYNVDRFFEELIGADGLPPNTVIIYTSDHGQTLSENGESWPHSGTTRSEACVPLFIVQNPGLQADISYKASHANIFATLLDYMRVPPEARAYAYAPSLLTARASDSAPRRYIFGTFDSYYGSVVYPFD